MEFTTLSKMEGRELADQIEQLARDEVASATDDEISGLIAQTNASGWYLDTLEVDSSSIEVSPQSITCSADAQFAGDQDPDSPPNGDVISGSITITIFPDLTIKVEDHDFEVEEPDYDE